MITKSTFETIKRKHSAYASWAVWGPVGATPKSGMADMSMFASDDILHILKPNVIMLGLNLSKSIRGSPPWSNFHAGGTAQDYKTRYAFHGTKYYGAYMTDIIKVLEEMDAGQAVKYVEGHPELMAKSLRIFREELTDLGASKPAILAFGNDAHRLAFTNLKPEEYSLLVKLPHYSDYRLNKETYKELVLKQIAEISPTSA